MTNDEICKKLEEYNKCIYTKLDNGHFIYAKEKIKN